MTNPRLDEIRTLRFHNRPWVYVTAPLGIIVVFVLLLWTARPAPDATMPDVRGTSISEAFNTLTSAGVCVTSIMVDAGAARGVVAMQEPPPGGSILPGAKVSLTVGPHSDVGAVARVVDGAMCEPAPTTVR